MPPFHQRLFWSRQYPILVLVDRPHFCKHNREPASTVEYYPISSGEDLARSPQSSKGRIPKSDRLLFLNMLKNSSRSNTIVPWSSWSSEGLLNAPLSRPPSEAFVQSLPLFTEGRAQCRRSVSTRLSPDPRTTKTTIGPIKQIDSSGTIWSRSG